MTLVVSFRMKLTRGEIRILAKDTNRDGVIFVFFANYDTEFTGPLGKNANGDFQRFLPSPPAPTRVLRMSGKSLVCRCLPVRDLFAVDHSNS